MKKEMEIKEKIEWLLAYIIFYVGVLTLILTIPIAAGMVTQDYQIDTKQIEAPYAGALK